MTEQKQYLWKENQKQQKWLSKWNAEHSMQPQTCHGEIELNAEPNECINSYRTPYSLLFVFSGEEKHE